MDDPNNDYCRRDILTKIMPACALTFLTGESLFSKSNSGLLQEDQQSIHMFDTKMNLTRRQFCCNFKYIWEE